MLGLQRLRQAGALDTLLVSTTLLLQRLSCSVQSESMQHACALVETGLAASPVVVKVLLGHSVVANHTLTCVHGARTVQRISSNQAAALPAQAHLHADVYLAAWQQLQADGLLQSVADDFGQLRGPSVHLASPPPLA